MEHAGLSGTGRCIIRVGIIEDRVSSRVENCQATVMASHIANSAEGALGEDKVVGSSQDGLDIEGSSQEPNGEGEEVLHDY